MAKKSTKKTPPVEGFPERLRQLRTSRRLSQEDLGKMAGLHYTHIGRYERGLSRPSSANLQAIAEALGVSSDYLMSGSTEEFAKARFEDQDLLTMFRAVETFPEEDKQTVKNLIDAFIVKRRLREMA